MKCENCFKKRITVKCMSCECMFCTACIQLEEHSCKCLHKKIENELLTIEKRNIKVESKKI